ncbi:hypothetical protein BKA93DRAFT_190271 [Sparassis latifolia]
MNELYSLTHTPCEVGEAEWALFFEAMRYDLDRDALFDGTAKCDWSPLPLGPGYAHELDHQMEYFSGSVSRATSESATSSSESSSSCELDVAEGHSPNSIIANDMQPDPHATREESKAGDAFQNQRSQAPSPCIPSHINDIQQKYAYTTTRSPIAEYASPEQPRRRPSLCRPSSVPDVCEVPRATSHCSASSSRVTLQDTPAPAKPKRKPATKKTTPKGGCGPSAPVASSSTTKLTDTPSQRGKKRQADEIEDLLPEKVKKAKKAKTEENTTAVKLETEERRNITTRIAVAVSQPEYVCKWCNVKDCQEIEDHIRDVTSCRPKLHVQCQWGDCKVIAAGANFRRHVLGVHLGVLKDTCRICDKPIERDMSRHMKNVHNVRKERRGCQFEDDAPYVAVSA